MMIRFDTIFPRFLFVYIQDELLQQDADGGVIMTTQSLVLQKVDRTDVGDYVCRAVNTEGIGESNTVPLKIMCKQLSLCKIKVQFLFPEKYHT